jgi:DDE superfamily endonuclease
MRQAKLSLPPSLVIAKAKQIATSLGYDNDGFQGSFQWLKKFRIRKGIDSVLLQGKGGEFNMNDPELQEKLRVLCRLIATYEVVIVYNMDETGLFFRNVPRYTLLLQDKEIITTKGLKMSKDRITLIVCAKATGTQKVPCTLFGKARKPACIAIRQWSSSYYLQNIAWMDVTTWWKWFDEVFHPTVKTRTGRPVLLLLNNVRGHLAAFERQGVRFVFSLLVAHNGDNHAIWE